MEWHHQIDNPFLLVLERECRGDARGVQVSRLREKHQPRGSSWCGQTPFLSLASASYSVCGTLQLRLKGRSEDPIRSRELHFFALPPAHFMSRATGGVLSPWSCLVWEVLLPA